jgi:hypothetical protein
MAHEFGNNGASPSPGLDGLLGAILVQLLNLLVQLLVDEGTFF